MGVHNETAARARGVGVEGSLAAAATVRRCPRPRAGSRRRTRGGEGRDSVRRCAMCTDRSGYYNTGLNCGHICVTDRLIYCGSEGLRNGVTCRTTCRTVYGWSAPPRCARGNCSNETQFVDTLLRDLPSMQHILGEFVCKAVICHLCVLFVVLECHEIYFSQT